MPLRKAFSSLSRKKGKQIQAQLQAFPFEGDNIENSQQRKVPGLGLCSQAKKICSIGRQKGQVIAQAKSSFLAKDAASELFARYVEADHLLGSGLGRKTRTFIHDVAFLVHSASQLGNDAFLPVFQYDPETVTEANKLSLGSHRLQKCVKTISDGYTRGLLLEKMPLYVLETDFLEACAYAKSLQSWDPEVHIMIAVVDLTSLKDCKLLISAPHIIEMLRLPEIATLEDKMLVWAEDWVVSIAGACKTIWPLRDAVLSLIDWQKIETSRIVVPYETLRMSDQEQSVGEDEQQGSDSTVMDLGADGRADHDGRIEVEGNQTSLPLRLLFRHKNLSAGSRETASRLGRSLPGAYI
ncbi:hypothetical protein BKA66DRAFT_576958 [Pyrenochaeta sp. MPI-SDFR-AT-0127]|nr:hypothetical protein BKA66DRAFT_576958 [Pyrenochaeta sp. MPI-SDFR-AT-0127]